MASESKRSGRIPTLLKAAVSIGLVAFLLSRYDYKDILRQLTGLSPWGIALLIALYFITLLVSAYKWRVLYGYSGVLRLFETIFVSHFYATVLPGQLFGEASKVVYLAPEASAGVHPDQAETLTASVVVDKLTSLISLLIVGVTGLLLSSWARSISSLIALFGLVLLVLLFALFFLRFAWIDAWMDKLFTRLETRFARVGKWVVRLRSFLGAWKRYAMSPGKLVKSTILGVLYQAIIICINFIAASMLGIQVELWDWCWICALLSIVMLLPITLGGIGLREGGYVGALSLLGVPSETALAISLIIFALQLLGALLGGVMVLLRTTLLPRHYG